VKKKTHFCQNHALCSSSNHAGCRLPGSGQADCPNSSRTRCEKTRRAFGNLRALRTSAFAGGAPSVRPPRVFRLSSVRPTPQGKGAHACTRARRSRERRYARHPPRISNVIRSRASASSFLALPAANADGRRRARARDAGSRPPGSTAPGSRGARRRRPAIAARASPPSRPPGASPPARPNEKTSRRVGN
jgi:hypothetical protein